MATGDPVPPLFHFCLVLPVTATLDLGTDGHPANATPAHPDGLPRRMWAGGSVQVRHPIRVGDAVRRRSAIVDVAVKKGRSGPLCLVTVEHQIETENAVAILDRQNVVYLAAPSATTGPQVLVPAHTGAQTMKRSIRADAKTLFRYSALTFNAHRIHYDLPYATEVEGYPGLVVHGPLQATWLCHFARDIGGAIPSEFVYRARAPHFAPADIALHAEEGTNGLKLWTAKPGEGVGMEATAIW